MAREAPVPCVLDRLGAPVAVPITRGPRAALAEAAARLRSPADAARWREEERVRAMLQPCARSLPSVRSGLKCWEAYCVRLLKYPCMQLPPASADLVAWSALFRCGETYANYCSYVKIGCLLTGVCVAVFDRPEVRRARAAVRARADWTPRPRLFIRKSAVAALVELGARRPEWLRASMLFLFAYTFLLRVPSEALPAVRVADAGDAPSFQAALVLGESELTLLLRRRKNRPQGSRLSRRCWCSSCRATCPVHTLGPWVARCGLGRGLFGGISAAAALRTLREMLAALGVQGAGLFRLHDLRRGHAKDLQEAGATLAEILAAGEWRSCAFMAYLDRDDLERDAVVEAGPRALRPRRGALLAPGAHVGIGFGRRCQLGAGGQRRHVSLLCVGGCARRRPCSAPARSAAGVRALPARVACVPCGIGSARRRGARPPKRRCVGPGPVAAARGGQPRAAPLPPTAAAGGVEALHARLDLW